MATLNIIDAAARFVRRIGGSASAEAASRHSHSAEVRRFLDRAHHDDSDWIESCTALVKHPDGRMEVVDWAEMMSAGTKAPAAA